MLRNLILEAWGSLLDNDEPKKVNGEKPWIVGEKRAINRLFFFLFLIGWFLETLQLKELLDSI